MTVSADSFSCTGITHELTAETVLIRIDFVDVHRCRVAGCTASGSNRVSGIACGSVDRDAAIGVNTTCIGCRLDTYQTCGYRIFVRLRNTICSQHRGGCTTKGNRYARTDLHERLPHGWLRFDGKRWTASQAPKPLLGRQRFRRYQFRELATMADLTGSKAGSEYSFPPRVPRFPTDRQPDGLETVDSSSTSRRTCRASHASICLTLHNTSFNAATIGNRVKAGSEYSFPPRVPRFPTDRQPDGLETVSSSPQAAARAAQATPRSS